MSPTTTPESRARQRAKRTGAGRRVIAGTAAAGLALVGLASISTQSASAATTSDSAGSKPLAQSVGNFLDATLGGNTLDSVAKLKYATAVAPGTTSTQNPLDAKVLNAIELPLTGALQLPKLAGIELGAVNQVAQAHKDGYSYGASGAVNNSGGVSVGGDNDAYPADASIDLCASALTGGECGSSAADALGSLSLKIGAVSALAQTPKGVDQGSSTNYQIANLRLDLSSPALGKLLGPVTGLLDTVLGQLTGQLTKGLKLPAACALSGDLGMLSLENGAVTLDAASGTLSLDIGPLLKTLGLDLNTMKPNTDLVAYLLDYLTSADGLAKGLEGVIDGLVKPLEEKFNGCADALSKSAPQIAAVVGLVQKLTGFLDKGEDTLKTTINGLVKQLGKAAGGNPLAPVADLLKNLVQIGVNVQPNGPKGSYTDHLAATPKQGTPVVAGQTIVRAIEVNVAATKGAKLPGLGGAQPLTAPSNTGLVTLALANAAAGPSSAAPTATTPAGPPATPASPNAIPTGVPAGMGTHGGTPVAPIVLLIVGLLMAGGGAAAFKLRGRHVV